MKRYFVPWSVFFFTVLMLLGAAVWITRVALKSEHARVDARNRIAHEERVRTALWRMDSYVSPLLAAESAWVLYGIEPPIPNTSAGEWSASRLTLLPSRVGSSGDSRYSEIAALLPAVAPNPDSDSPQDPDYSNRLQQTVVSQITVQNAISMNAASPVAAAPRSPLSTADYLRPSWYQGQLLLALRSDSASSQSAIRVSIIDWDSLRPKLLALTRDVLPHMTLEATTSGGAELRRMASLPVELRAKVPAIATPFFWTPTITVAWAAIGVAIFSFAALLGGTLALSERRRRFVSAVTHELRTPLTTFQLYSEMLRDGMVPPDRQPEYFDTLRREALRLQHLVDNVLAFARLERGSVKGRVGAITVGELVEQCRERIHERAAAEGLELVIDLGDPDMRVQADAGAVDQILFNLVDNACKHGVPATVPRVDIQQSATASHVEVRVCDYGPGFREKAQRPQTFSVTAEEAATRNQPGVGLGLGLSRQLAKAMGGQLKIEHRRNGGSVLLRLQIAD